MDFEVGRTRLGQVVCIGFMLGIFWGSITCEKLKDDKILEEWVHDNNVEIE